MEFTFVFKADTRTDLNLMAMIISNHLPAFSKQYYFILDSDFLGFTTTITVTYKDKKISARITRADEEPYEIVTL